METRSLAKPRLTADEIDVLRAFIMKRGFREPKIVSEILDHFACKIEELWIEHPGWTFGAVAEAAHKSFGYAGFRPLAEAAMGEDQYKYNRYFWKVLGRNSFNIRWLLVALLQVSGYVILNNISKKWNWQFLTEDHCLILAYMAIMIGMYNVFSPRITKFQYQFIERLGGTKGEWLQLLVTNTFLLAVPGIVRIIALFLSAYIWMANREVKLLMLNETLHATSGKQKFAK